MGLGDRDFIDFNPATTQIVAADLNGTNPRIAALNDIFGAPSPTSLGNPPSNSNHGDIAISSAGQFFLVQISGPNGLMRMDFGDPATIGDETATFIGAFGLADPIGGLAFGVVPPSVFTEGVFIIQPLSPLPPLSDPTGGTTIDGRTQTAFTGDTNPFGPEIVLDGSMAGVGDGLLITTDNNKVFDLTINQFSRNGITIHGNGNWVAGNYIGTNATGTVGLGNELSGIHLIGDNNLIGANGDGTPLVASLEAVIENPTPESGDAFGISLAEFGGGGARSLLIGSRLDDLAGPSAGAVYKFGFDGTQRLGIGNPQPTSLDPPQVDNFGASDAVAAVGNNILVGASAEDLNPSNLNQGIAYLFDGSTGALLQTLSNPDPSPGVNSDFGKSVAGAGLNAVVGAPASSTFAFQGGAVYMFDGAADLLMTFSTGNIQVSDHFGWSVAALGNNVLVGAPRIDTNHAANPNENSGAAYLFDGDPASATFGDLLATLLNPTPSTGDQFGYDVTALGNNALIGTLNGEAAYLFDADPDSATFGQLLTTFTNPNPPAAATPSDEFGRAVAGYGSFAVVGAPGDDDSGSGVVLNTGAVYVFDAATGNLMETIFNPTPETNDSFGFAVEEVRGKIAVGSIRDDAGAADAASSNAGAVYVFEVWKGNTIAFNNSAGGGSGDVESPLVEYLFNEGGGSVAINTGSLGTGTNASLSGGYSFSTDVPVGSGSSIDLNGSSGFATVPDTFDYTNQLTVEAWIKPDAVNAQRIIWDDYGNPGVLLDITNGQAAFAISTTTHPGLGIAAIGGTVDIGRWQHIAGVYDGFQIRVYLNGELVGAAMTSGNIIDNGSFSAGVGADNNGNALFFDGKIDDFRIFNAALSRNDLAGGAFAAVNNSAGVRSLGSVDAGPGLVEYRFEEGGGSAAINTGSLGTGTNASLSGGYSFSTDVPVGSGFSIDLNGSSGFGSVPDTFDYTNLLTVEAWIKPDAVDGQRVIWDDYGNPGVVLDITNGQAAFAISTTTHPALGLTATGWTVDTGRWQHIAGVYDGSQIRVYLDGVMVGAAMTSGYIIDNGSFSAGIGADNNGNALFFDGKIDDFRIFNAALSPNELAGGAFGGATGNTIRGNSIHNNTRLGIDLVGGTEDGFGVTGNDVTDSDSGPNDLQNFPTLSSAVGGPKTRVVGSFNSTPNTTFTIDVYAGAAVDPSGFGEGERFLGSTTLITDGSGDANFDVMVSASSAIGESMTATATNPSTGSTSEFSGGVTITEVDEFDVGPVTDIDDATLNAVDENAANGTTVGITAFAEDLDATNNTVTYSLDDDAGGRFAVDTTTGVVTVADGTLLDREAAASHNITVRATSADTSFSTKGFTIDVLPVNDNDPVAVDDSFTVSEGATFDTTASDLLDSGFASVLGNDTDADLPNDALTVTLDTDVSFGALSLNADGTFSYVHDGSENFTDSFTYIVSDADGGVNDTGTVTITITPVNDNDPVATDDSFTVNEGAAFDTTASDLLDNGFASVLGNDSDADLPNDTLTVTLDTDVSFGALTLNADGTFSYIHDNSENFTDSFTYIVSDANGGVNDTGTVTITVNPVNDNDPVAADDSFTVNEGAAFDTTASDLLDSGFASVLGNDIDADLPNDTLTVALDTDVSFGALTLNADGTFSYIHDGSENFTDSFTYTVSDANGGVNDAGTVTITINPVNDNDPVATDDSFTVIEGATFDTTASDLLDSGFASVLGNDSDADLPNDTLTVTLDTDVSFGALTLNADGTFSYIHDGSENFTDSFIYIVGDANGGVNDTGTVTITVTPVNDNDPVAADDSFTVNEGATFDTTAGDLLDSGFASVLGNDTDADLPNDTLTATLDTDVSFGALTLNADGTFSYVHDGSENFTDSFTYIVSDANGGVNDTGMVTITPVNDNNPVITSDGGGATASINVVEDTTAVTTVTASDADLPAQTLTFSISGGDDAALFTIDGTTGELSFLAAPDFENPTDTGGDNVYDVQVTVSDPGSLTDSQNIAVTVTQANQAPFVNNPIDDVTANEDGPDDVIDLSNVFDDPDAGDSLTLTVTGNTDPTLLNVTIVGTDLTLDYSLDQSGTADITIRASDGGGLFVEDTFTVTVLSAQQQLQNLIDAVENLGLNNGNTNALTVKLINAIDRLDQGKINPAVNQINAFINQVNAFAQAGTLSAAEGQALIDAANDAIQSASTTSGAGLMIEAGSQTSTSADETPVARADELVIGAVGVFFDDVAAPLSADQQARFGDSIDTLNAAFGVYGVTLLEVDGPADAVIIVEVAPTSEIGGLAEGVLGYTVAGHVTLLSGWDWYAGVDPLLIGSDQYDLQTILTHELGHSAGLVHSGDPDSVMYAMLAAGETRRSVTATDLSLLEAESNSPPQALLAAPRRDVDAPMQPDPVVLMGGIGRDLLVGGTGKDLLFGGWQDDILIAGYLNFADRDVALSAVMAEWTSERDYAVRVRNLTDGTGSQQRLNGDFFLVVDETVKEDEDVDLLTGGGFGRDWFFFDLGNDKLLGRLSSEVIGNDLDTLP